MRFRRQEIYYYNTESGFETEKFAGRLLMMILEGMQEKRKTEILFLCIGTGPVHRRQPGTSDRI